MKKLLVALALLFVSGVASAQTYTNPIVTAARPTALQLLQASAGGTTWAPVTMGGDTYAANGAGLFYVSGLTGQSNTVSMKAPTLTWSAALTPSITQTSTTGSTGANFNISTQASTAANGSPGSLILTFPAPTGTGAQASFQIGQSGSGSTTALGTYPGYPAQGMIWMGAAAPTASQTTGNYALRGDGNQYTYLNSGAGTYLYAGGAQFLRLQNGVVNVTLPIVADSSQSSPYGVHGDVTAAFTATSTLTSAQYAEEIIIASPTAAMTLSGFPRAAATMGYKKMVVVTAAFAVTVSDGTHSVILPAAIGKYPVVFTNAAIY